MTASTLPSRSQAPEQIPLPKGPQLITTLGPGLVLAMSFLGVGDLTSSSTSGANYGYALIWTLVLSLLARTFIVSTIAKYALMNRHGHTQILEGFASVAKWLPAVMTVVVLVAGFVTQAGFLKACAIGLYNMFGGSFGGEWGQFAMAIIVVGASIGMISQKKQFTILEYIARIASVLIIVTYIFAIFKIGTFDVAGFFRGMLFEMPKDQVGTFAPIIVAAATIGTIAGNMPNLLYPGFMKDKGWTGPKYRKLQQLDLIAGMGPLLIINLLFWIVAAEYARAHEFVITSEQDLATLMNTIVGPVGPFLLWMSLFLAAFTSFPAMTRGFAQLAISGIHLSTKSGAKWAGRDEEDPLFKWLQIGLFTALPIVAALPKAPNLIALGIAGTALSTLLALPAIVVVMFILTSSKKHMHDYAVNKPWETVVLGILSVISIGVGIQIAINLPQMIVSAFGG